MKHKLRLVAFLTIAFLTLQMLGTMVFAEEDRALAQIIIEDTVREENVTLNYDGCSIVTKDGRKGLSSSMVGKSYYIWVNIAEKAFYDLPNNTPVDITVDYFDEGDGTFTIGYDSYNPQAAYFSGNEAWRSAESVHLEDTKTWKTHTFHIEDARFMNRCNGYDFRIQAWDPVFAFSSADVVWGNVTVKKGEYETPLLYNGIISDTNRGNIFSQNQQINLGASLMNKTERDITAAFEGEVLDKNKNVIQTFSANEKYKPGETKVTPLKIENPKKYAIYDINIRQTAVYDDDENSKFEEGYKSQFSISTLISPEDRNPHFGACQQTVGYGWGDAVGTTDVMLRGGFSYVRDECTWADVEKTKGTLVIPPEKKEAFQYIADQGLDIVWIASFGNPHYDNGNNPSSEEGIAAFARYCGYMAKELKGIVKYYEIWNEWNITAFNKTNEPPETYAKVLKAAYTEIKKVNPDAIVLGLDPAGVPADWIKRVLDAGAYDYMDVASVHPYDFSGQFDEVSILAQVDALKNLMRQYGELKPIWATEGGFSTFNGAKGYTREEQAAKTVFYQALSRGYDLFDVFTQYCMHDHLNPDNQEHCWGFIHSWEATNNVPFGAKESYIAASAMTELWGNAEFKDKIVENRRYAFQFYNKKINKDVMILVTGDGRDLKSYDLGCKSVDIYDMYGNYETTLCSDTGVYTFVVDEVPFYVIGNFSKFAASENKASVDGPISKTVSVGETVTFDYINNTDRNLTANVETEGELKVVENAGFTGNKAQVKLQTSNEYLGTQKFKITFKDEDGNIYYMAEQIVETVEPLGISITAEQAVENSDTHWRAKVVVENRTNKLTLGGTITVTEPIEVAEISKARSFKNLKPGDKITFLYNFPERITKKPIDLKLKAELDMGYISETKQLLDFGICMYTDKKPTIDGNVDVGEWQGSWIGADEKKDVRENKNWAGPADLSFSSTTMWDEENFYLLAIVTDDIHCVRYDPPMASYMWRGDMVQFGLDDREVVNIVEKTKFTDIGLANVSGEGDTVWRYNALYDLPVGLKVENAQLAVKRYDTYTVYELAMPWSEIFYEGYEVDTSRPYAFSMLANDNDTGSRKGWIEYTSGIGYQKNVEQFGTIRFYKPEN